jgi:hypothetical protein
MSAQKNIRGSRIGRAFAVLGAAISVSAAVEGGRRARTQDLETLGIDAKAFNRIG